jgi:hypothetical protein
VDQAGQAALEFGTGLPSHQLSCCVGQQHGGVRGLYARQNIQPGQVLAAQGVQQPGGLLAVQELSTACSRRCSCTHACSLRVRASCFGLLRWPCGCCSAGWQHLAAMDQGAAKDCADPISLQCSRARGSA